MYRCLTITLALSVAGCFAEGPVDGRAGASDVRAAEADSIAWPREYTWPAASSSTRSARSQSSTSVGPVSSLVEGLQARLARNQDDAKGWALLAQSYAFMADGPKAEEAVARAVKLGFNEADLRHRVEMASQSALVSNQTESTWVHPAADN